MQRKLKKYEIRMIFKVDAEDRFNATRKVSEFIPETNQEVFGYYIIGVKPETNKKNCTGCDDFDSYGCVYQFINAGECRRETPKPPKEDENHKP
jgi:hypothetical protein